MTSMHTVQGREVLPVSSRVTSKTFFLSPTHMFEFSGKDGETFVCLEQFIQYQKAKFFNDDEAADKILHASTVRDFQKLGSKVKEFNAEAWEKEKYSAMRGGISFKFSQNISMAKKLARTAGYYLALCGFRDKFWSCNCKESDPIIYHPSMWTGKNMYGKALMCARDILLHLLDPEYSDCYREAILNAKYYPQSFIMSRIDMD